VVGFTGVRPPATPGLGITGEEAGEVEEATGITLACSSELGKRRIGGATAGKIRRRRARWGRGTVRERRREECGEVRFASGWLDFI
jgi:hypothetical protein